MTSSGPAASSGVLAVNHVGISVRDLEAAHRFWTGALGALDHGAFGWPVGSAPADESLALEGTAAEVVLLRTETAFLELFAFGSPTPEPRGDGAPGVRSLTWAVPDVVRAEDAVVRLGGTREAAGRVRCPDGVAVRLVPATRGTGLVGVEVLVEATHAHLLADVPGPVAVELVPGAASSRPRPVDHGVNHVCLDVDGIDAVRAGSPTRWHHPVTESSGGAAAVCYGTTHDGVLVELLESRAGSAFLSRTRLTHA